MLEKKKQQEDYLTFMFPSKRFLGRNYHMLACFEQVLILANNLQWSLKRKQTIIKSLIRALTY